MLMFPTQRWHITSPRPQAARTLALSLKISPLLGQILLNRDLESTEAAEIFFEPQGWQLPDPLVEFDDLAACVARLHQALRQQEKIAICGDYDCDGMTSTALLIRAFKLLGLPEVHYEIPSRLKEGYGVNERIIRDLAAAGYRVLITVDNGISALAPLRLAQELGLDVIITDHHDLPPVLPPAVGILNPKLIPETSPYHSLAGVGMAYILAVELAATLGRKDALTEPLLELFTLGTVADMAHLTGVNRAWVKRGLKLLPLSQNPGIQALMLVGGYNSELNGLNPEAIGFGLGPRINAVGRIGDPELVITLLTTDDPAVALERAQACDQLNRERQAMLKQMELEAKELLAELALDLGQQRVLVLAKEGWHPGLVGLVASRVKDKTGCPAFVAAITEDQVRGSARGIPEFNVFEALCYSHDFLEHFGGHPMAGGFSCTHAQWPGFQAKLIEFAQRELEPDHIRPLVEVDVQAGLHELSLDLFEELERFQPCGLRNPEPLFWSAQVKILEQQLMGKNNEHMRLMIAQGSHKLKVVAWQWGDYYPLPDVLDIAYKLKDNVYQGRRTLQLDLQGVRLPILGLQLQLSRPEQSWDCRLLAPDPADALAYVQALAQTETVLLYGYNRPALSHPNVTLDRPESGKTYTHLVYWTQPPSAIHHQWLTRCIKPQQVHQLLEPVTYLSWSDLLSCLETMTADQTKPLNLLALAQQYWLSPSCLLAGLQELRLGLHLVAEADWGVAYVDLRAWYSGLLPLTPMKTRKVQPNRRLF